MRNRIGANIFLEVHVNIMRDSRKCSKSVEGNVYLPSSKYLFIFMEGMCCSLTVFLVHFSHLDSGEFYSRENEKCLGCMQEVGCLRTGDLLLTCPLARSSKAIDLDICLLSLESGVFLTSRKY